MCTINVIISLLPNTDQQLLLAPFLLFVCLIIFFIFLKSDQKDFAEKKTSFRQIMYSHRVRLRKARPRLLLLVMFLFMITQLVNLVM